uniref:Uncharacterized protein n=1 Tax=Candidatus Kentrum sp. FW TaxID=2126338 RepID=A0A450T0Q7_9GAMM|nr:MAG: hypothetical protein BECKFW1821A_GA0114235_10957 [Candidatus Kentron sp. FW]
MACYLSWNHSPGIAPRQLGNKTDLDAELVRGVPGWNVRSSTFFMSCHRPKITSNIRALVSIVGEELHKPRSVLVKLSIFCKT